MEKTINEAIKTLCNDARTANPDSAMKYSQAVLNLAKAWETLICAKKSLDSGGK